MFFHVMLCHLLLDCVSLYISERLCVSVCVCVCV